MLVLCCVLGLLYLNRQNKRVSIIGQSMGKKRGIKTRMEGSDNDDEDDVPINALTRKEPVLPMGLALGDSAGAGASAGASDDASDGAGASDGGGGGGGGDSTAEPTEYEWIQTKFTIISAPPNLMSILTHQPKLS